MVEGDHTVDELRQFEGGKLELTLSSARKRHAKPYWMRMLGCLLSRTAKLGVVLSVGVVKY